MSIFGHIFGQSSSTNQSQQQAVTSQQQNLSQQSQMTTGSTLVSPSWGGYNTITSNAMSLPVYVSNSAGHILHVSNPLFDIDSKLKSLQEQSNKLAHVNKELELINNLHPVTIEVIKLAYEISKTNNLEDLNKMDQLIKKRLFSNKLEDIINE